jgi:hypothetical protein
MSTQVRTGSLPQRWRKKARQLRSFAPHVARAFQLCASEQERATRNDFMRLVTVEEAVKYTGYSRAQIYRLPQYEFDGQVRVCLAECPFRPGYAAKLFGLLLNGTQIGEPVPVEAHTWGSEQSPECGLPEVRKVKNAQHGDIILFPEVGT